LYVVQAVQDPSKLCGTDSLSCTVTGLTNGIPYTFTVTARNAGGTGPTSAASAAITPATVPTAPNNVTAVSAGPTAIKVAWTAPDSNGGATITIYRAVSVEDTSKHCLAIGALTCSITGLTGSASYTFTVAAINAVGTGPASQPSTAATGIVTPHALRKGMLKKGPSLYDLLGRIFWNKTANAPAP